jgi:hypothetical protein
VSQTLEAHCASCKQFYDQRSRACAQTSFCCEKVKQAVTLGRVKE